MSGYFVWFYFVDIHCNYATHVQARVEMFLLYPHPFSRSLGFTDVKYFRSRLSCSLRLPFVVAQS